MHRYTEKTSF